MKGSATARLLALAGMTMPKIASSRPKKKENAPNSAKKIKEQRMRKQMCVLQKLQSPFQDTNLP
jgi:hypothetical protein